MSQISKAKSKVCLLPVEVAGYQSGLSQGLFELGWSVRQISISNHPFDYPVRIANPGWATFVSNCVSYVSRHERSPLAKLVYLAALPARAFGALWVAAKFQVVILNAGRSLLPFHLDLILFRMVGMRVIAMLGHGSEARPPCLDCLGEKLEPNKILTLPRECKARRRFVRRVEALSHIVISTPTIGHYLTRDFLNGNDIGVPVIPTQIANENLLSNLTESPSKTHESEYEATALRVVHAPSNPRVKGSEVITRVLRKLESEGLVELKLVSGLTNQQVKETLSWADLLVDQLYSDIPLPVLASEAAYLRVPTMIGSNNWPEIKRSFSKESWPPAIFIHPDDLEEELRNQALSRENLQTLGGSAKTFVELYRTPSAIAAIYETIILGDQSFDSGIRNVDPRTISYVAGCGSSQEAINQAANNVHRNKEMCWKS